MPALFVVPGSKCAGPDDRDSFVISSSSLSFQRKAKTVHPPVAGRRFGVDPLAGCERVESASCDLSSNIKSAVRRRFVTPERARREQLPRHFPTFFGHVSGPNAMSANYEIIEHSYDGGGTTWR